VALERAGVEFVVHEYELTHTEATYGESVAATLGVSPERLFKTLVAEVDGRHVVGIVPTHRKLGLKALAGAADGKKAKMADPADAERLTGYVTGGISPFGQKRRLPVFVDRTIEKHATVYVSGGRRGVQVELSGSDLVDLLSATEVDHLGV
jgi:Cys-tRNA(Pro)/Cys-tRNA(Cys) deacylase